MIDDVITFRLHRIKDVIRLFFLVSRPFLTERYAPISTVIRQLKHTLQFFLFSIFPSSLRFHLLALFPLTQRDSSFLSTSFGKKNHNNNSGT